MKLVNCLFSQQWFQIESSHLLYVYELNAHLTEFESSINNKGGRIIVFFVIPCSDRYIVASELFGPIHHKVALFGSFNTVWLFFTITIYIKTISLQTLYQF